MSDSGFVLLDKPAGDTSFKSLFPLKRLFGTRRVGHAGTLDLRASGLIIAAVERATRLLPFVEAESKLYTFKLHLGFETDTLEWDGELKHQGESLNITLADLERVIPNFIGDIKQVPPDYSAIKINGHRASDLMERGREVTLPARDVKIFSLKLIGLAEAPENCSGKPFASFALECHCSKGTYIRSLCRDLGKALGTFGVVSEIRRMAIGKVQVLSAHRAEDLQVGDLLSADKILPYPVLKLPADQISIVRNGNWLPYKTCPVDVADDGLLFVADEAGVIQSLCYFEPGRIRPKFFIGPDDEETAAKYNNKVKKNITKPKPLNNENAPSANANEV